MSWESKWVVSWIYTWLGYLISSCLLCLSSTYVTFRITLRQDPALYSHAVILLLIGEMSRAGCEVVKGMAAPALSPIPSLTPRIYTPSLICFLELQCKAVGLHASHFHQQHGGTELRQQVPDCKHWFECYQTDLGLEIDQGFSIHVH